ncbi:hypothetical protein D0863_02757 [Hortaea werneckii]|uniref:Myb-like domain-containing protein n=1 Tax=Hortaea werneckii TaxID=91943 RepID=A0A3M7EF09_HORWE|nr:hypothetical protein D0863_02757 [Hortaea werneckii]
MTSRSHAQSPVLVPPLHRGAYAREIGEASRQRRCRLPTTRSAQSRSLLFLAAPTFLLMRLFDPPAPSQNKPRPVPKPQASVLAYDHGLSWEVSKPSRAAFADPTKTPTYPSAFPRSNSNVDPSQMCGDLTAGLTINDWYDQPPICQPPSGLAVSAAHQPTDQPGYPLSSSTHPFGGQNAYNDSYMTPFPSSTVDSQTWGSFTRTGMPNLALPLYSMPEHQSQTLGQQYRDLSRPKSSPSTFGPGPESAWPATTGLGIQYTTTAGHPTPNTSTFPPNLFQTYPIEEQYNTSSPPELRQPQPQRPYTNIAPNPAGAIKRQREEEERAESNASKRRKRTSSVASADLSEDDRFLVQLKEDESLPWKEIATRFQTDKGKNLQVAALQMRYKRLRERFRLWEDQDVQALRLAHEYWEKYKWEIISSKMLDFGLQERWPPRHCARKWQELEQQALMQATSASLTPGMSHFSSPDDGPVHFAFMPIQ